MTGRNLTRELRRLLDQRILLLDGAMGTMIQGYGLDEAGYRGERFRDSSRDLKGDNDLLSLTQPDIIREIHTAYLEAGADIVETNTFNATAISQADYGLEAIVYELNRESARLAREAADALTARTHAKPRFVAGVLGPTNRTASISPDVNDPGFRNVTFDALVAVYTEATRGLIDGGADLLLIETVFDTLNAKAAIYAVLEAFLDPDRVRPVMISGTITDASGRTLSGQTPEAFWNSVAHAEPLLVGFNCALGAKELRPHVQEISRISGTYVSTYPNAGLPNAFGGYDATPDEMAGQLREFAESGLVNLVGGCCGTTPEHIAAIQEAVRDVAPRRLPEIEKRCRLSGLEPLTLGPVTGFVNVGERTNVAGLGALRQAHPGRRFRNRSRCGARPSRKRRPSHRREHGRSDAGCRRSDAHLPEPGGVGAGHLAGAGHGRFFEMDGHRSRPQMRPGKRRREFDQSEGGRGGLRRASAGDPPLRGSRDRHGVRYERPSR